MLRTTTDHSNRRRAIKALPGWIERLEDRLCLSDYTTSVGGDGIFKAGTPFHAFRVNELTTDTASVDNLQSAINLTGGAEDASVMISGQVINPGTPNSTTHGVTITATAIATRIKTTPTDPDVTRTGTSPPFTTANGIFSIPLSLPAGKYSLTYTVKRGDLELPVVKSLTDDAAAPPGTISINAPPVANADPAPNRVISVKQGGTVSGDVSVNDSDPDDNILTYEKVTGPEQADPDAPFTLDQTNGRFTYKHDGTAISQNNRTVTFSYRVRDIFNLLSAVTTVTITLTDTDLPGTPAKPDLNSTSDTGSRNGDDRTSADLLSFQIANIEPGATVTLLRGGMAVGTFKDQRTNGQPTVVTISDSMPITADGKYIYTAFQTDANGNQGNVAAELELSIDRSKPSVTLINNFTPDPADASRPRNRPVSTIDVTLSEPIDLASLNFADLALSRDGRRVEITAASNVLVSPLDLSPETGAASRFRIAGLQSLTSVEGTYRLTIVPNGIEDITGNVGMPGPKDLASWILDTTMPVFASTLPDVVIEVLGTSDGAVVTFGNPTFSDNRMTGMMIRSTPVSGSVFLARNNGTDRNVVTFTITDEAGNTSLQAFRVTVLQQTQDTTGPTLQNATQVPGRGGSTRFLLTFSEDVNAVQAQDPQNYSLRASGRDRAFGNRDDIAIPLRSATYDAALKTVTLTAGRRLRRFPRLRLMVNAATPGGITDTKGNALDGDRNGQGGDHFAIELGRLSPTGLRGRPASRFPRRS